jgi:hypothetical protein
VEGIAAGLGYDIDQSAAVVSVFGVRIAGEDAKLGDGFEVGMMPACWPMLSCTLAPLREKPLASSRCPLIENWPYSTRLRRERFQSRRRRRCFALRWW